MRTDNEFFEAEVYFDLPAGGFGSVAMLVGACDGVNAVTVSVRLSREP